MPIFFASPAYAALPSSLSVIEQTISQKDGVYLYDQGSNKLYFTADDYTASNLNNDGSIGNNEIDYVVFDESAVIKLYYQANLDRDDLEIAIRYNRDSGEIYCGYEYSIEYGTPLGDDRDDFRMALCDDNTRYTPLDSFQISGETVYVLNLRELCSRDQDQDRSCSDTWNENVSSFSITEVGKDVSIIPTSTPSAQEPINVPIGIAEKVQNLYTWAVSLAGLVALGIIIFGGVLYAASAGNPSRITEAKSWITHALLGLSLLFGSYLILGFINPDLTRLEDIFLQQNVNPQSPGLELGAGVEGGGSLSSPPPVCREACKNVTDPADWANVCNRLEPCPEWYCPLIEFTPGDGWLVCRGSGGGAKCPWNKEPGDDCSSDHSGIDLHAQYGAPVFAIESGTISKTYDPEKCGFGLRLEGDSSTPEKTIIYSYCHLGPKPNSERNQNDPSYSPRIMEAGGNIHVSAGEHIGFNGDSGNAGVPHVHFSVSSSLCTPSVYDCTVSGCYWGKINAAPIINTACEMNIPIAPSYIPPPGTCGDNGGLCVSSSLCDAEGAKIPGITCPTLGRVCCDLSGT